MCLLLYLLAFGNGECIRWQLMGYMQFLMGMHFPKLQGQSVKMVVMFLGIGTLYNLFMIMGNQGKTEQEETTWERKNLH